MSFLHTIRDNHIAFGINAQWSLGGQGEFMRLMGLTLQKIPRGECFGVAAAFQPDFIHTFKPNFSFFDKLIHRSPLLRQRIDWRVLRADTVFDQCLSGKLKTPDLFDGVMGQCRDTFSRLKKQQAKLVLTSLNTHPNFIRETLASEHQQLKIRSPHFLHPTMHQRMIEEIEMADHVRVNSQWAKMTFTENGVPSEKISVIHPGINHNHFHPVPKKDDVFRVMAVTTLEPRKGILYLLQAFKDADIPNSELVLTGYTSDRWSKKILQEFMEHDTRIKIKPANILSLPVEETFGTASVIVHPAIEDGFGLVIPQGMAAGRPVIATRQSGASELIRHGETGFIVERRSPAEIKKYLLILFTDSRLRTMIGERAAESVKELTYEKFSDGVFELYRRVLDAA